VRLHRIVIKVVKQISEEYGIPEEEVLSIAIKRFKEKEFKI